MKKSIIITLVVGILCLGIGAGSTYAIIKSNPSIVVSVSDKDDDKADDKDSASKEDKKDSVFEEEDKVVELRVGDTVNIGGIEYTFVSYNGNTHGMDEDGNRGCRIEISCKNTNSKKTYASAGLYPHVGWNIDDSILELESCYDVNTDDEKRGIYQDLAPGQEIDLISYMDIPSATSRLSLEQTFKGGDEEKTLLFICEE